MISLDACDSDKFSSAGYGKNRPLESNDTEEGRRQNRRVEIVFIRNDMDFTDPEVLTELLQLEFGNNFVLPSGSEGGAPATENAEEVTDVTEAADSGRSDPTREYVSKEDVIADMQNNRPQPADSAAE